MLAGQKYSKEQKARFFELLDRDGSGLSYVVRLKERVEHRVGCFSR